MAIVFDPAWIRLVGICVTSGLATAVDVDGAAVAYVVREIVPDGMFARATSVPLTYTTSPSSARVVSLNPWKAPGLATVKLARWYDVMARVCPAGTSMFVAMGPLPQPSGAGPNCQEPASNAGCFHDASTVTALSNRYRQVLPLASTVEFVPPPGWTAEVDADRLPAPSDARTK